MSTLATTPSGTSRPHRTKRSLPRRVLAALGPGVVTGAADDDPSGIATYSIAGAQLGTALLWTALVTWPLMAAAQMMCARIGMVTGHGLAGALRQKFPRALLVVAGLALLAANTINIAADLSGMADAAAMLSGLPSHYFVVGFGVLIAWATIRLSYARIARTLKWLALSLCAYVATAFMVDAHWGEVLHDTLLPSWPSGSASWATLVAILGTTISPYLFFWQASEEVEAEKTAGRLTLQSRRGASSHELVDRRIDVGFGSLFSNLIMFFVILTTALTLHRHGITHIHSSQQAAAALAPLVGRFAASVYTLGIIGVGLLSIPTLTGSAAYALCETFGWEQGLSQKLGDARYFYGIVLFATAAGIAMDFLGINALTALFWSAVINGVLAPFLLVAILLTASDRAIMQGQPSSWISRVTVGFTALLMFGAAFGMFVL